MKQQKRSVQKRSTGILIAAAVCAALSGVTVAAATGTLDLFRNVLSQTTLHNGPESPAALVSPAEGETAVQHLAETETVFTGTDSLRISTVAMNYDSNTLMLTLALEPQNGITLPERALFVPYFQLVTAEGVQQLSRSGIGAVEQLVTDDTTDTCYLTYYLTQPEIAGSTLRVTLQNAYTPAQIDAVCQGVNAAQEQWAADYGRDSMKTAEWKSLWQAENLDGRTQETEAALLAESDKLLCGTWTADIAVPETDTAPLTLEKDGFRITADTLSLRTKCETETTASEAYLITFTDGTVLCEVTGTNETAYLKAQGLITDDTAFFAYTFGADDNTIHCYDAPHPVSDIAEIRVCLFDYKPDADGRSALTAAQHILYTAP